MMLRFDKLLASTFVLSLFLDRILKYAVMSGIFPEQDITSFLEVYLTFNRGVSWGIGSSTQTLQFSMVSGIVGCVILFFTWYAFANLKARGEQFASMLILSGAVSNFYDRLMFYGVVDFIHFHYGQYSFPVFNVADIFICVGTFYLLYVHLFDQQ